MGNITDYVIGYGRYTIEEEPFNEVDSLVLSQNRPVFGNKISFPGNGAVRIVQNVIRIGAFGDETDLL